MRPPRWRRSIEAILVAVRPCFLHNHLTSLTFCVLAHMPSGMLRALAQSFLGLVQCSVHRSSRIVVDMGILSCDRNALQSTSWPAIMVVDPWYR